MTSFAEGLARDSSRALDSRAGCLRGRRRAGSRAVCGPTALLLPVDIEVGGVASRSFAFAAAAVLVPSERGAIFTGRCSEAAGGTGLPMDFADREKSARVAERPALTVPTPSSSRRDVLLGAATFGSSRRDALLGRAATCAMLRFGLLTLGTP
eukprot:541311-Pleurochrysis_carterae.AAC.2